MTLYDNGICSERHADKGGPSGLLLHSCCAPCSSHVLSVLTENYCVTVFYYNPNIFPKSEYLKRRDELLRLLSSLNCKNPVSFVEGDYSPELFSEAVRGFEGCPEGGERCRECFLLRLSETAKTAKRLGFGLFATTLSVSPHKNSGLINEIGFQCADVHGLEWLKADFKKNGGYQRSVELSKQYGLYRQRYCGCEYSMKGLAVINSE